MGRDKVRKPRPVRVARRGVTRKSSAVPARVDDPVQKLKGMFTGLYPKGYLKKLRGEWRS